MKLRQIVFLALLVMGTNVWVTHARAEDEGIKKPRSLWVTEPNSSTKNTTEEADSKKDIKLRSKKKYPSEVKPGQGKLSRKDRTKGEGQ